MRRLRQANMTRYIIINTIITPIDFLFDALEIFPLKVKEHHTLAVFLLLLLKKNSMEIRIMRKHYHVRLLVNTSLLR
jgi:hypothetical protein